jgi:hypothetical protein
LKVRLQEGRRSLNLFFGFPVEIQYELQLMAVHPYSVSIRTVFVMYCYELFQLRVLSLFFNIMHFA